MCNDILCGCFASEMKHRLKTIFIGLKAARAVFIAKFSMVLLKIIKSCSSWVMFSSGAILSDSIISL